LSVFFILFPHPLIYTLFPYTTLFRSNRVHDFHAQVSAKANGLSAHFFHELRAHDALLETRVVFHFSGVHQFATVFKTLKNDGLEDRKSTRLNSSHVSISYAVFCLKKK